ncbi:hypothetical protein D0869_00025 [Hortaea werneckii]|uniref:PH domain-containing protein n=1 Tax=Hortaea werneckii TaxID=91943 RepID=A0A3M6XIG3_HORWE|nr:hypothetical protein KC324_g161 [Hortaea werneckii]KAI7595998.1 hypothetical protein KC316_g166 [Hortaea werneckii]RMX90509.1 hypothetical protein D0869_00025 [Hortaea werneckii]
MATSANLPTGAIPTNGSADPFVGGSPGGAMRYASFDTDNFSMYSANSPSHARRALEAHLKDTDRRIQDASKLGTTLLQQRKELAARIKDVEQAQEDNEMPADLRQKLSELEKEYNEVGRESARAFLPRTRAAGGETGATPVALSGSGRESPTKASAPSRRQRNQASNRVHDIEFATEISTSLLAQVRQLQAALAEKDEMLRNESNAKAQIEADVLGMAQRMKHMDESEQHYKDQNWELEMKIQELESAHRDMSDKHDRLHQNLKSTELEKATAQRELDDLKLSHEQINEDHTVVRRQQEGELHGLRRDIATHQSENDSLHKKLEYLTAQNTELARAASYRFAQPNLSTDSEFVSAAEERDDEEATPDPLDSASPMKGTPRHGMLETETLKSSLNHAHRMIQNLKNNIHREKTERFELKRLLQDARDELEARRNETGISANFPKKRKSEDNRSKKPAVRPERLGANRSSTTEILEDEEDLEWEDHEAERTPSKPSRFVGAAAVPGAFGTDTETSDAFETANEKDTATENEAFETGNEDVESEDEGQLTETESGVNRSGTIRGKGVSPLAAAKAGDRTSYMSTASTSADEADEVRTPVQTQGPKYRLRVSRGGRRSGRVSDMAQESPRSPTSSQGTPQPAGQSLGDELDGMSDDSAEEGTPAASPETTRQASAEPAAITRSKEGTPELDNATAASKSLQSQMTSKPEYADAGVMTEPWQPEEKTGLGERVAEVAAGTLAGFGLGKLSGNDSEQVHQAEGGAENQRAVSADPEQPGDSSSSSSSEYGEADEREAGLLPRSPMQKKPTVDKGVDSASDAQSPVAFAHSTILSQETEPVSPPPRKQIEAVSTPVKSEEPHAAAVSIPVAAETPESFGFSNVDAQAYEPSPGFATPILPKRSSRRLGMFFKESQPAADLATPSKDAIPGTDSARPGAALFAEPAPQQQQSTREASPAGETPQPKADLFTAPAAPEISRNRSMSMPASQAEKPSQIAQDDKRLIEPKVFGGVRQGEGNVPTLVFGDDSDPEQESKASTRTPLADVQPDVAQNGPAMAGERKAQPTKAVMADGGSQTAVSGDEIEEMLRNKSRASSMTDAAVSPFKSSTPQRRSIEGSSNPPSQTTADAAAAAEAVRDKGPRRPGSSTSMRSKTAERVPPPLPEDYTQKITLASQKRPGTPSGASNGTMGPPTMPASAYKQGRSKTAADFVQERSQSRDGTTPRPRLRESKSQMQSPSTTGLSRRESVSSFASELDERFNITRGNLIYPSDVKPSTDPRMIQAITQTMIGEFLWKYTRKAGRSETSNTRHRRFFWIHPYTRTLYWSERDPSTAGASMLKAKSMAIQAVRVVTDDNAYPPGLHRKSIVVVTPGREIVFTAPTGQRHETWFNALSYLLLRTEQEKGEAEDEFATEDLDEFNPGFSIMRSISRMTGRDRSRSRQSMSSYNSRSTRPNSPQKREPPSSLANRHPASTLRQQGAVTPTPPPISEADERTSTMQSGTPSMAGRFNSFTGKLRPSSSQRGSFSTSHGRPSVSTTRGGRLTPNDPSDIYEASVVGDSAEDLRAVIQRQEEQADRLENVRACCDGKHDVGSLSHRGGRHASFASKMGGSASHSHSHPPKAEPMSVSSRPRRGE